MKRIRIGLVEIDIILNIDLIGMDVKIRLTKSIVTAEKITIEKMKTTAAAKISGVIITASNAVKTAKIEKIKRQASAKPAMVRFVVVALSLFITPSIYHDLPKRAKNHKNLPNFWAMSLPRGW